MDKHNQGWSPEPWGNAPNERNGMGWPCWGSQNQEREGWAFQAPDGANARRIVACVNACAGIENPEAIGEVVALVDSFRSYLEARSRRDAHTIDRREALRLHELARAALAKLGGGHEE